MSDKKGKHSSSLKKTTSNASESVAEASSQPRTVANQAQPGLTVFGNVLDLAIQICDPLTQVAITTKQTSVSDKAKLAVKESLKDFSDVVQQLAFNLDDLHLAFAEIDGAGNVKPSVEEQIQQKSEAIIAIAISSRIVQSKHAKLKSLKDQVETIQRKTKKIEQTIQDQGKASAAFNKLVEKVDSRKSEVAEISAKVAETIASKAKLEKEAKEARARLQSELDILRSESDRLKSVKRESSELKLKLASKKADRDKMLLKMKEYQEWEEMNMVEMAEMEADHHQAASTALLDASIHQIEPQTFTPEPMTNQAPYFVDSSSSISASCPVCFETEISQLVLLMPCLHYICRKCILRELQQSTKSGREFKFSMCPTCHDFVEHVDGGETLMGDITYTDRGFATLTLTRKPEMGHASV